MLRQKKIFSIHYSRTEQRFEDFLSVILEQQQRQEKFAKMSKTAKFENGFQSSPGSCKLANDFRTTFSFNPLCSFPAPHPSHTCLYATVASYKKCNQVNPGMPNITRHKSAFMGDLIEQDTGQGQVEEGRKRGYRGI